MNGWHHTMGSRKGHYMRDGVSLCRRYTDFGATLVRNQKTGPEPYPQDCRTCHAKALRWVLGDDPERLYTED